MYLMISKNVKYSVTTLQSLRQIKMFQVYEMIAFFDLVFACIEFHWFGFSAVVLLCLYIAYDTWTKQTMEQ